VILDQFGKGRVRLTEVRSGSKTEVATLERHVRSTQEQTSSGQPGMSVSCHQRTHALQQKAELSITSSARSEH
jgi:hypothetical protein